MATSMRHPSASRQGGTSMIEVLVTIVILTFGLLGLVGLQSRLQLSEIEAYQRAQALLLLEDMANRMSANRNAAASYVTSSGEPLGAGNDLCTADDSATLAERDACEWNNALLGAAETANDTQVGSVIGGRGCVEALPDNEYLITVAWQGMGPIAAPSAQIACGLNSYNGTGESACVNDRCRRVVTTIIRIGTLI